jgi:hypothetical protein
MQPSRTVVEPSVEAGRRCGEASATEVTTHRLGEFGMNDVGVFLPFVLLNPHLQHVSV